MAEDTRLIEISSGTLSAAINPFGAELTHLRDAEGRELMTDADPAYWTGHAPILFPIVGALNGDTYRVDGRRYSLPKHGFARRMLFEVIEASADRAHLRLAANDETLEVYPWAFSLELEFEISFKFLTIVARITNDGSTPMPASFGFHPAFAWPLPYGHARADHRIIFAEDEPGGLRVLTPDGLIAPGERASPLDGRELVLADGLFANDALIWDPVVSRRVAYGAENGPALTVDFPDAAQLGIWTKPGAHYVCIEPWNGIADPQGFDGEIWDKPGILRIPPGAGRSFTMLVTLHE